MQYTVTQHLNMNLILLQTCFIYRHGTSKVKRFKVITFTALNYAMFMYHVHESLKRSRGSCLIFLGLRKFDMHNT